MRCRGRTWRALVAGAGAWLALAAPAAGTQILGGAIPLIDLLGGVSIQIGTQLFEDLSYVSTGDMPDAADVNLVPIADAAGAFGFRLQGAFVDLPSSPGGSDALISFRVTALGEAIDGVLLAGNPALLSDDPPLGSISVVETFDFDPNGEAQIAIFDDEGGGTRLVDRAVFGVPRVSFVVTKDILGIASDATGGAAVTLSFVDQTFTTVPEPEAAALLALGLVALAGARRRVRPKAH